jgi:SSS family solute:Na+ symporter
LGVFLVAFFLKKVGGTAVFWAAVATQLLLLGLFFFGKDTVAYLWLNPIGCAACVGFALFFQALLPKPQTS